MIQCLWNHITQVNETSHQQPALQTTAGCWLGELERSPALNCVGMSVLSLRTPGCLGRACWQGRSGDEHITAGCCSVEPGVCASPVPSTESWLWPRALGSCELHPSRETEHRGWNALILRTAAIQRHRVLLWLRWQALLLSWMQRFRCSSTLLCLYFCDWGHVTAILVACRMPLDPLLIPALEFLNLFSEPRCL